MRIVSRGEGTPVVVIPGVQGRWEWMTPTIDALAARCRVITFSLADEPSCEGRFDETRGFRSYVDQVGEALDTAGVERAAVCGVSYGGLVAAAFAAQSPERVSSLVLVSAIPPSWTPNARVRFFLLAPQLLSPVFMVASLRLYREIAAAYGGLARGLLPGLRHALRVLTHMFSPRLMARRVRLLERVDLRADLARVTVPVLVITGDARLDRVVPVQTTREYLGIWPHARSARIERTGHLGSITRPDVFASLVVPFAEAAGDPDSRRRVG
jgi:pimeloyl-ACP methyl ester carboxylesterase